MVEHPWAPVGPSQPGGTNERAIGAKQYWTFETQTTHIEGHRTQMVGRAVELVPLYIYTHRPNLYKYRHRLNDQHFTEIDTMAIEAMEFEC